MSPAGPPRRFVAYVAHWLGLPRGDRRAIFTAAGKAQAAAEWLIAAAARQAA